MTDDIIKHFSFSSLNLFATCQASWWAKYVEKKSEPSSPDARFGLDFEACLAQKLGFEVFEETENKEELSLTPRAFNDDMHKFVDHYRSHNLAWDSADGYQEKIVIDPDKFQWLAKKYKVLGTISRPYHGYLDFTRGKGLMDTKTSKRGVWKPTWAIQQLSYCLGGDYDFAEVHQFVRTKTPKCHFYHLPLHEENGTLVLQWIAAQASAVDKALSGEVPVATNNSWLCSYCVRTDCPARSFNEVPKLGE